MARNRSEKWPNLSGLLLRYFTAEALGRGKPCEFDDVFEEYTDFHPRVRAEIRNSIRHQGGLEPVKSGLGFEQEPHGT